MDLQNRNGDPAKIAAPQLQHLPEINAVTDCLQQGRIRDAHNVTASTYVDEDGVAVEKPNWPTLLGIKNNVATIASEERPWEFVPDVPEFESAEEYKKWRAKASTEHLCYLGTCGLNPGIRPNSKQNPVAK